MLAIDARAQKPDVLMAAAELYATYTKNSGGKAWDGKPCPSWADLGNPVRSHWCAVVLYARSWFAEQAAQLGARATQLEGRANDLQKQLGAAAADLEKVAGSGALAENARLKADYDKLLGSTTALEEQRVREAVADRTKTLEDEVDGLRAKVAKLEKEQRTGGMPWHRRRGGGGEPAPGGTPPATGGATGG